MSEIKRYRVTLEKVLPDPSIRNPFSAFRTAESFEGATCKVLVRTWEFDAKNEKEVRRLFDEAKSSGEPQVQGMRIRSIEEIGNKHCTCPSVACKLHGLPAGAACGGW